MIYTLPFISAIIGWFTNYIAVLMLFRPRKPFNFLGYNIQGIFPKRQALIAAKIGKMVADELLSVEDIQNKIHSPDAIDKINSKIEEKIDFYLNNSMPEKYPIMSLFIGSGTKTKIKNEVLGQVSTMAPDMIGDMVSSIGANLNIEESIKEKVTAFPPERLEKLLNDILKNEFTFIEWVGAFLGFVIGLIQLFIALLFPNS
jgi:uncharacterized membrane protein YheB (UPF0754 family)